jgi:hypothetical protein
METLRIKGTVDHVSEIKYSKGWNTRDIALTTDSGEKILIEDAFGMGKFPADPGDWLKILAKRNYDGYWEILAYEKKNRLNETHLNEIFSDTWKTEYSCELNTFIMEILPRALLIVPIFTKVIPWISYLANYQQMRQTLIDMAIEDGFQLPSSQGYTKV